MTTYVILTLETVGDTIGLWKEQGEIEAHGAVSARKQFIELNSLSEVTIVAIPKRSWQPKRRRTQTFTRTVEEGVQARRQPAPARTS